MTSYGEGQGNGLPRDKSLISLSVFPLATDNNGQRSSQRSQTEIESSVNHQGESGSVSNNRRTTSSLDSHNSGRSKITSRSSESHSSRASRTARTIREH